MSDNTDNYVPLAMTANFWVSGKPTTPYKTLVDRLRREAGSECLKKYGWIIYLVHPDFEVCGINGDVFIPAGAAPAKTVEDKRRIEGIKR